MGSGCMKDNNNVYFRARKNAAMYNEKLSSREGAAEMLGICVSTLADYELDMPSSEVNCRALIWRSFISSFILSSKVDISITSKK